MFFRIDNKNLKCIERLRMASILKSNIAEGYTQPDIKIYYKATVVKTVKCWHKIRKIYQWNSSRNTAYTWTVAWFITSDTIVQWGETTVQWGKSFLINSTQSIGIPIPHYPEKSIWEGRYKKVHSVWFHLHKAQKQEKWMTENKVFLLLGNRWLLGDKWEISGVGGVLFFDLGDDYMVVVTYENLLSCLPMTCALFYMFNILR